MLVLPSESHSSHAYKTMTALEFTEILAEELVMNKFDGDLSRPQARSNARLVVQVKPTGAKHILKPFGLKTECGLVKEKGRDRLRRHLVTAVRWVVRNAACALASAVGTSTSAPAASYVDHPIQQGVSLESQGEVPLPSPPAERSRSASRIWRRENKSAQAS
jgi:hypothetical protein